MLVAEQVEKFGYAIIEDFLNETQLNDLKLAGKNFINEALNCDNKTVSIFNTSSPQFTDRYFMDSADKISFFYEQNAFDDNGDFKIKPETALNKVGHALHRLHPTFADVTNHEKVREVCRQLKLLRPVVVQSMYIYKNPKVGGEVKPHQDASYLYTEPFSLYGFWFAVDDATEENGCLWFIPGSHKSGNVPHRFMRNPDKNSTKLCLNYGKQASYEESDFLIAPVKKGSCVIIHGNVIHRSLHNYSNKSRHAYTFHIYDSATSEYSKDNWLQTDFISLY